MGGNGVGGGDIRVCTERNIVAGQAAWNEKEGGVGYMVLKVFDEPNTNPTSRCTTKPGSGSPRVLKGTVLEIRCVRC